MFPCLVGRANNRYTSEADCRGGLSTAVGNRRIFILLAPSAIGLIRTSPIDRRRSRRHTLSSFHTFSYIHIYFPYLSLVPVGGGEGVVSRDKPRSWFCMNCLATPCFHFFQSAPLHLIFRACVTGKTGKSPDDS